MDNRRKHARYAVAVAAELETSTDTLAGQTRDVSEGGASVMLDAALSEGSQLRLTLLLTQDGIEDPHEEPFETDATVSWAAPTDSGACLIGLRFAPPAPELLAKLKRFLAAAAESTPAR
jgi:hypothetical protein